MTFQYRNKGIRVEDLSKILQSLNISERNTRLLVSHLENEGYLTISRELVFPSQKTLDLANRGFIHSNISNSKGLEVINALTGEKLGEIGTPDTNLDSLILGGRLWKVSKIRRLDVLVVPTKGSVGTVRFVRRGSQGAFYNLLPRALKENAAC
jgi:hypothetical protein